MSLRYIRRYYEVPAHRGARVEYTGHQDVKQGTVVGSAGARLRVRMDGEKHTGIYHPTWCMSYLPAGAQAEKETHGIPTP